jgi:hypothetical protein
VFALLLLASALGAPPVVAAADRAIAAPVGAATAKVAYLAGGSVYVDAGRLEGLRVGDSLQVTRAGKPVARLRVAYLSSHRAACDTLGTLAALQVGDVAAFVPHALEGGAPADSTSAGGGATAAPDSAAAAGGAPAGAVNPVAPGAAGPTAPGVAALAVPRGTARPRPANPRASRIHGRIGARFLTVQTGGGGRLTQPALDLRLDGSGLSGGPFDLALDFRGRRVTSRFPGQATLNDDRGLFYRFSLSTHDAAGRYRLTLGRQLSPALAPVNLFDGALAERHGTRWDFGVFSGAQPEPARLGISSAIVQGGGYAAWHQPPGATRRWSLVGGGISSYDHGNSNRDFGFLQAFYLGRITSATLEQELDWNRGWRRDLGQPTLQSTGTFLTTNLRPLSFLSLRGGFDNRRNVRLYRDRTTPENLFDDRYRQGAWAGAALDLFRHLRLTGDGRSSSIANTQRQDGWTGGIEGYRFTPLNLTARARISRLSGAGLENSLDSYGVGIDLPAGSHVEVTAGRRVMKDQFLSIAERTQWEGADLDLTLLRQVYLNGSFENDHGGLSATRQAYFGLSWRF